MMNFLPSCFSLFFFLIFSSHAFSNIEWDAKDYAKNSSSQAKTAQEIIRELALQGDEKILDIGCGDGKLTYEIFTYLNHGGEITGLDPSPTMINLSQKKFPYKRMHWVLRGAEDYRADNAYDVIVSFTALQWVVDQEKALENMYSSLKRGGKMILSLPSQYPDALKLSLQELMGSVKWKHFFQNYVLDKQRFFHEFEYKGLLRKAGFQFNEKDVRENIVIHTFENFESLKNFIAQWLPHLREVPAEGNLRNDFMKDLITIYQRHVPKRNDARASFYLTNLKIKAFKK